MSDQPDLDRRTTDSVIADGPPGDDHGDRGTGGPRGGPLGRLWRWVALDADRRLVTGGALALGFLLAGPVGHYFFAVVVPLAPEGLADRHTTVPLVSALLSGNFLLFSIVVSVNSLFVSQEQNPLGRQFGRVQSVVEYRRNLEEVLGDTHVPADPAGLVRLLAGEVLARARAVESELAAADADIRGTFDSYVDRLATETGETTARLEGAAGTFGLFRAVMDYDHDRQINDLRRIRGEYAEALGADGRERVDELLRLLQYFATAREYFKTLYLRDEFAKLSRDLVVTMVPTTAVLAITLHFLAFVPSSHLVVAGIETLAFLPFVLVASYVLRVAVVTRRTQSAGQFVAGDRAGDIQGITDD